MLNSLKKIDTIIKSVNGKIVNIPKNIETIKGNISIDSRTVKNGDLFIPIKGENFDGHNFISQSLEKGAIGTIFEINKLGLDDIKNDKLYIEVKDSLSALQNIGKSNRVLSGSKIIGITGTNGKTSTKEIIGTILKKMEPLKSFYSKKNFNNQIGVPLNLINIKDEDKFGVIEMGASGVGDIEEIASLVLPNVGIITNIAPAHLEGFGSIENILATKLELFKYVSDVKIVNNDNPYLNKYAKQNPNIETFGYEEGSDLQIIKILTEGREHKIKFSYKKNSYNLNLKIAGIHNVYNFLSAIIGISFLQFPFNDIVKIAENIDFEFDGRLKRYNYENVTFYDDTYNANPLSVQAGVNFFNQEKGFSKKIIIVGEMKELGDYSEFYHKQIGTYIDRFNFDNIFLIGEQSKYILEKLSLSQKVNYCRGHNEIIANLKSIFRSGDKIGVYLKGSRGNRLEKVLNHFIKGDI